jgi:predicted oxidoreductase (fatty acid repression mutant protein)
LAFSIQILFYEDPGHIKPFSEKFPVFADKFPVWAQHSSAMLQHFGL